MRVCINSKIAKGPSNGLNQFLAIMGHVLEHAGHTVFYGLAGPSADLIMLTHPCQDSIDDDLRDLKQYMDRYPGTLVVHRINNCDEHIGYGNKNRKILEINRLSNHTVFISSFLKDLFAGQGFNPTRPHSVILNGADERLFNPEGRGEWRLGERLKVITHHWSSSYTKGFDIYERIDLLLDDKIFSDLFEFTFVGNLPKGLHLKNTKVIAPLYGQELARTIKHHHVYVTATRNEAAGMHHIEGMRCGLPVLYLGSGALPEYCSPYGIEFNLVNFEEKLLKLCELYPALRERVLQVPYTASRMVAQYEALFLELLRRNPSAHSGS